MDDELNRVRVKIAYYYPSSRAPFSKYLEIRKEKEKKGNLWHPG